MCQCAWKLCVSVSVSVSACLLAVLCVGIARRTHQDHVYLWPSLVPCFGVTVLLDEIVRVVMKAMVNAIRRVKI